jgi:plastocyanin
MAHATGCGREMRHGGVKVLAVGIVAAVLLAACGGGGYGGSAASGGKNSGGKKKSQKNGYGGYGGGGGGRYGKSSQKKTGKAITIAGHKANGHGSKVVAGKSSTELELDSYYFAPTVLLGKPGQAVTLELSNKGSVKHNFSIDSEHIDKNVGPGAKAEVSVTFPRSGILSFYCKYHQQMGMRGELKVK